MSAARTIRSSFSFDFKRYLRSPALWFVALAAPIAAHYMVPDKDAAYAVLTINSMRPQLTASVLGLELGIVAATLLIPLAYIFLRAGPTRHRPWQVSDVAPHSRIYSILGRWAADTVALWILLAALTVAGLILGLFRIEGGVNIFKTVIALWLPAAPALAFVAAIRLALDARNLTRRWLGDVAFFFIWMGLTATSIFGATDPETQALIAKPVADVFGFTTPIIGSVDYPVTAFSIGGSSNVDESVLVDAWRGVTDQTYIGARGLWIALSGALAIIAGLCWAPMKTKQPKSGKRLTRQAGMAATRSIRDIAFAAPTNVKSGSPSYLKIILSEIKLILRGRAWLIALGLAAVSGALFPFRTIAGPAILLALIFPLTEESSRWQAKSMGQLLDTMGPDRLQRTFIYVFAAMAIAAMTLLPAILRALTLGELKWLPNMGVIILAVPVVIAATGALTRSAVAGRLIMLIAWYVYLSSAGL